MNSKRSVAWFAVFTLVVMLTGGAGGVLLDRHVLRHDAGGLDSLGPTVGMRPGGRMGPGGGGRPHPPGAVGEHLRRRLELTQEQSDKLRQILDRRRDRIEAVRGEMRERMEAEQRALHGEIRAMLRPDQQKRFDELMAAAPGPRPGARGGPGLLGPGMPGAGRGTRGDHER